MELAGPDFQDDAANHIHQSSSRRPVLSHENHAGGLGGARLPVHIYPACCFLPERGDMCVQHTKKMVGTEHKTFGDHAVITVLFSCPASGLQKGKRKFFSDSPCIILPVYYSL